MKYYIIAGEASGDLHAANMVRELRRLDPEAQIAGWGGELMSAQGVEIRKHYRELAFMGFIEVLMNLRTIFANIRLCKSDIESYHPDVIIFIDYPGFNLRIAQWARQSGYKTVWYISPQLWAWKEGRVEKIRQYVDKMLVILPFEEAFYAKHQYPVTYVGHPLLDVIPQYIPPADFLERHGLSPDPQRPIIALLPGSRTQEIETMLPLMLSVMDHYPQAQFVIAGAPGKSADFYTRWLSSERIHLVMNETYALYSYARAALVTSGTATLEAALFNVPEVVCYKGSPITYAIARRLIKVKYISLVNLIADRLIVPELIQSELTTANLITELDKLLYNSTPMQDSFAELRQLLGGPGASRRAADAVWSMVKG